LHKNRPNKSCIFFKGTSRYTRHRDEKRINFRRKTWRRPLGKPRRRWVNNIAMDLKELWCESVDWTDVAHDKLLWHALVKVVMIQLTDQLGDYQFLKKDSPPWTMACEGWGRTGLFIR
jgi:hypothetical protein